MRRCGKKTETSNPTLWKKEGESKGRGPCYNAKEVANLFGYGSTGALWSAVKRGLVPEPEFYSGIYGKAGMWKKSVVDRLIEERRHD